MHIIPTIYLRDNKALRIETGGGTFFNEDPVVMARELSSIGAELLHLVDLNTPATGNVPHLSLIKKIADESALKIQLSGNIRSEDIVEKYISSGCERVIVGIIGYQKPDFLKNLCQKFPGKIAMNIEVISGKVVIKGWAVAAKKTALDYAEQFHDAGVSAILYSDVEREGLLNDGDIKRVLKFSRETPIPILHSTDVSSTKELELLMKLESPRILGTILGKSMYNGTVDIATTIAHAIEETPSGMDEPTLIP